MCAMQARQSGGSTPSVGAQPIQVEPHDDDDGDVLAALPEHDDDDDDAQVML